MDFRYKHDPIRKIVVEVQNALAPYFLPKMSIGLENSMKDVMEMLESVSVIGLFGMVGVGKTTLAIQIYNHFYWLCL